MKTPINDMARVLSELRRQEKRGLLKFDLVYSLVVNYFEEQEREFNKLDFFKEVYQDPAALTET